MPFCSECGHQIDDNVKFCPECGSPSVRSTSSGTDHGIQSATRTDQPSTLHTQLDDGGAYGLDMKNLAPGFVVDGRYRIEQKVGVGGFAAVYRATDISLDKTRALKVFLDLEDGDDYALSKLKYEADLMDKITDERVVRYYDLSLNSSPKFAVLEYVDGGSLEQKIVKAPGGKLPEKEALKIAHDLAEAMQLVHSKGIIHKDLNPRNIMFSGEGNIKIMDFGISEALQTSRSRLEETSRAGTAPYMSPEQIIGKDVGKETDVWSFGCILYQMLTGKICFSGRSRDDVHASIKGLLTVEFSSETRKLSQYGSVDPIDSVSDHLNDLIQGCLTYDYTKRVRDFGIVLKHLAEPRIKKVPAPSVVPPVKSQEVKKAPFQAEPEVKLTPPTLVKKDAPVLAPASQPDVGIIQAKKSKNWFFLLVAVIVFSVVYFGWIKPYQQMGTPGSLIDGPLAGMVFVEIPGGSFQMGSPSDESGRYDSEGPQHGVTVSGFEMLTTEVTQAMWVSVMGSNPSHFKGDNLPVEQVSWNACQDFIKKLNQRDSGKNYRLPGEAEWEYACRAGTTTRFYSGNSDSDLDRVGWYSGNSDNKTHPVGQKQPNAWGLYDLHGNVWEWCQDWYGYYPSGSVTDPRGPSSGSYRVYRGGSGRSSAKICRSAYRGYCDPSFRLSYLGFRLLRSL